MDINDNQADITVQLDGVPMFKGAPWATYAGGDLTSTDAKTRTGGMGAETTNGGTATRNDATLTIQWSDIVLASFKAIELRVGKGAILITANWLDGEGVAVPNGVYGRRGKLKGSSDPNFDANGNVVGMFTIVCSLNELAA